MKRRAFGGIHPFSALRGRSLQPVMGGGLVLVAEHDETTAEGVRRELALAGHEVVVVESGVDAIAELHGAHFDVLVIERGSRGRSVFDVLAAAEHLSPETVTIVTAEEPSLETALTCIRAGAFDFLVKPLRGCAVAVARALEHRRLKATTDLYRASEAIFRNQDPEKLPGTIVEVAARVMEAEEVALALAGDGDVLTTVHARAVSGEGARAAREGTDALASRACALGRPLLLPEDCSRLEGLDLERGSVRSTIVYPMYAGDRRVGALVLSRITDPRPFRRADVERAGVIAAQALLAVDNAALVRRMLQAERLASIGELAAGVAHEINNPLTYMLVSINDARERIDELSAQLATHAARELRAATRPIEEALADADEGAKRIAEIASDLRTLAHAQSGRRETVDLNAAIRSALRITASQTREVARIETHLCDDAFVVGHAGRLSQVFVNLVVNAAQAAAGTSENPVLISVRTERIADHVVATVSDTGPGIAPEHQGRLFEPFFTTKGPSSGTGLGLAVTRTIVAEHGGSITVESAPGAGATFRVALLAQQSRRAA